MSDPFQAAIQEMQHQNLALSERCVNLSVKVANLETRIEELEKPVKDDVEEGGTPV
jgi:hypothetical protein|tara:strand:- start:139 stop:306 length:168 start_codon:yes stop_codon:yes gene_type:complete